MPPFECTSSISKDQFLVEKSNFVYLTLIPLLDELNELLKSNTKKELIDPTIQNILKQWLKILKSTHSDKNRDFNDAADEFFKNVICGAMRYIVQFKSAWSLADLSSLAITNLELKNHIISNLVKITVGKANTSIITPEEHLGSQPFFQDDANELEEIATIFQKTETSYEEMEKMIEELLNNRKATKKICEEARQGNIQLGKSLSEFGKNIAKSQQEVEVLGQHIGDTQQALETLLSTRDDNQHTLYELGCSVHMLNQKVKLLQASTSGQPFSSLSKLEQKGQVIHYPLSSPKFHLDVTSLPDFTLPSYFSPVSSSSIVTPQTASKPKIEVMNCHSTFFGDSHSEVSQNHMKNKVINPSEATSYTTESSTKTTIEM